MDTATTTVTVDAAATHVWRAVLAQLQRHGRDSDELVHDPGAVAPAVRLGDWTVTAADADAWTVDRGDAQLCVRVEPDGPARALLHVTDAPPRPWKRRAFCRAVRHAAVRFAHFGTRPGASTVPQRRAARRR